MGRVARRKAQTYSDLEIHHLLRKSTHLIIETEAVLARVIRREHKIPLSLLAPFQHELVVRPDNRVVDIERATGLDLFTIRISNHHRMSHCCGLHCPSLPQSRRPLWPLYVLRL